MIGMKNFIQNIFYCVLIFILGQQARSQVNFPALNLNVPINTVVGNHSFVLINSCQSQDFHVITTPTNGGLIPVASGVQFVLKINGINIAFPTVSLTCLQTGTVPVVVGNTYTFTNPNNQFQFTCVGPATVNCQFLLVGTPTNLNQSHECGYDVAFTLGNCQNSSIFSGYTQMPIVSSPSLCNVGISNGLIEKSNISKTEIFPNPSNGEFFLQLNAITEDLNLEVYNAIGQLVFKDSITEIKSKISLVNLPSGIYFMKIKDGNNIIRTEKIVKE
jgi:hypothetical protein